MIPQFMEYETIKEYFIRKILELLNITTKKSRAIRSRNLNKIHKNIARIKKYSIYQR